MTGMGAVAFVQQQLAALGQACETVKADPDSLGERLHNMQMQLKESEKALIAAKQKLASQQGADLLSQCEDINGVKVLVSELEGVEAKALRGMMDDLKNRLGEGVIMLGMKNDGKVNLIAGVTKSLTSQVKAGELVNFVAAQVGGKGGGRPDMAQAGGDQPENLSVALDSVLGWLKSKL